MIHCIVNQSKIRVYAGENERRWNSKRGINENSVSINVKVKIITFKASLIIILFNEGWFTNSCKTFKGQSDVVLHDFITYDTPFVSEICIKYSYQLRVPLLRFLKHEVLQARKVEVFHEREFIEELFIQVVIDIQFSVSIVHVEVVLLSLSGEIFKEVG